MKICIKCGTDSPKQWDTSDPPICSSCYQKEYRMNHREKHKVYMKIYNKKTRIPRAELPEKELLRLREKGRIKNRVIATRFKVSRRNAIRRGHSWNLTFEEYVQFLDKSCYYCDGLTSETASGLDRIDNTQGYSLGNVRPCCRLCNQMKSVLTEQEFYARLCLIVRNLKLI